MSERFPGLEIEEGTSFEMREWLVQRIVIRGDFGTGEGPPTRFRVDGTEVKHAARESHGLERMEQIRQAVVEKSGAISIIPREAPS